MNRIFSGIQPTGNLHLGNYLGAIRNWVALQHDYECIFCIVDLHALTLPQDPLELRQSTREVTAAYIAAGIDPEHCIIFNQSMVSAHAELAWLLGCLTPLGWLNRMTQFKEKAGKHRDNAGLGLYAYPVLMAADILLYKATHVPVGEDQKQHLELARDIAGAFNRRYEQDFFPLPEPQIFGEATRVMSLRDGTQEDVEIRHLGLFAPQHDRRRRRDRAQGPPRQDRSRAAARDHRGAGSASGGGQPRRHLCRADRFVARNGAQPLCRAEFLRLQGSALGSRGRGAGPDRRRDAATDGRSRPYRHGIAPRRRARRRDRQPVLREVQHITGLLRP